jgi:hypothetical protein
MDDIVIRLLTSEEPAIRYKTRVNVLGEDPVSSEILHLQQDIKNSPRCRTILQDCDASGRLEPVRNPYQKWLGAHWVLATLADIGYPHQEIELQPIIDQVLILFLNAEYWNNVPQINGKYRRCASQQGNILFSTLRLAGPGDQSLQQLVQLLLRWQ